MEFYLKQINFIEINTFIFIIFLFYFTIVTRFCYKIHYFFILFKAIFLAFTSLLHFQTIINA